MNNTARGCILACLIFGAGACAAQISDALIEGCNALQDSAKRLECLKAAVARPSAFRSNIEPLERAFLGLKSALSVGMSFNSYHSALQDVAKEIAVYEKDAGPEQGPGIVRVKEALDTYRDAGRFWEAAISFYSRRNNSLTYFGGLPVQQVGLDWMVSKHGLPTRNSDLLGFFVGVPTDQGRTVMWLKAQAQADEGMELLRKPAVATAAPQGPPQVVLGGLSVSPTLSDGVKVDSLVGKNTGDMQVGDRIIGAGDARIFTIDDFRVALAEAQKGRRPLILLVVREGKQVTTMFPAWSD